LWILVKTGSPGSTDNCGDRIWSGCSAKGKSGKFGKEYSKKKGEERKSRRYPREGEKKKKKDRTGFTFKAQEGEAWGEREKKGEIKRHGSTRFVISNLREEKTSERGRRNPAAYRGSRQRTEAGEKKRLTTTAVNLKPRGGLGLKGNPRKEKRELVQRPKHINCGEKLSHGLEGVGSNLWE